jgi:hypothetical protein
MRALLVALLLVPLALASHESHTLTAASMQVTVELVTDCRDVGVPFEVRVHWVNASASGWFGVYRVTKTLPGELVESTKLPDGSSGDVVVPVTLNASAQYRFIASAKTAAGTWQMAEKYATVQSCAPVRLDEGASENGTASGGGATANVQWLSKCRVVGSPVHVALTWSGDDGPTVRHYHVQYAAPGAAYDEWSYTDGEVFLNYTLSPFNASFVPDAPGKWRVALDVTGTSGQSVIAWAEAEIPFGDCPEPTSSTTMGGGGSGAVEECVGFIGWIRCNPWLASALALVLVGGVVVALVRERRPTWFPASLAAWLVAVLVLVSVSYWVVEPAWWWR